MDLYGADRKLSELGDGEFDDFLAPDMFPPQTNVSSLSSRIHNCQFGSGMRLVYLSTTIWLRFSCRFLNATGPLQVLYNVVKLELKCNGVFRIQTDYVRSACVIFFHRKVVYPKWGLEFE